MSDLLESQAVIYEGMVKLYTNFRKDGKDRKTLDYYRRRLETLEKYWEEYEHNHDRISTEESRTIPYFTEDRYNITKNYYKSVKSTLEQEYQDILSARKQPAAEDMPSGSVEQPTPAPAVRHTASGDPSESKPQKVIRTLSDQGSSSKLDEMLRKQTANFKAFMRTVKNINLDKIQEKWEFEDSLKILQSRWSAIDSLHWEIDSELNEDNPSYEISFTRHEEKFNQLKRDINNKLWSVAHREQSTPKLDIPEFRGHYNQWISFKDLFTEAIHNNPCIPNARKMQYLKGKVKGEAERLIQHLQISSDNYSVCWDILNHRYNNLNRIFNSHINILMSIPVAQQQSLHHIKRIHDTSLECLNAIKNLGVDIKTWDPLLVNILSQKLDSETYNDYMEFLPNPRDIPVLKDFLEFLEAKFTTLETSRKKQESNQHKYNQANFHQANQSSRYQNSQQKSNLSKNTFSGQSNSYSKNISNNKINYNSKYNCPVCNNDHGIYFCPKFLAMPPYLRRKTALKQNLCPNCLYNHHGKTCISSNRCKHCNLEHNTLLHEAFTSRNTTPDIRPTSSAITSVPNVQSNTHITLENDPSEILLATAVILVQAADGTFIKMRALLDQGSQMSLISHRASQLLGLPRQKCKGFVVGIGGNEASCNGFISINCKSNINEFSFKTDVLVMKSLIKHLPGNTFPKPSWSYLQNVKLADPEFYVSRQVDILLGADIYSIILMDGIIKSSSSLPTAQQTQLGWILSGQTKFFQCNVVINNLEGISKFWEIEDIAEQSSISSEDQACIDFYQSTTTRRQDGKYEVRLPLKQNYQEKLGNSKNKAIAQFYQLERKFNKDKNYALNYKNFMNEHLSLGHMTPATSVGNPSIECYLPHFGVTRDSSSTTPLRVIVNASSKTSSGYSLNEVMCRGPNLQQDLQNLIIKWRLFKYAFTADIEKMFRNVWLHSDDQNLQKLVWRERESDVLKEYKLTTVIYGTKAAPFLAMMTLRRLAQDEKINYQESLAPEILETSFYMDDLLYGVDTKSAGLKLKQDLTSLLKAGGFNLRKWKSNLPELLDDDQKQENFEFRHIESSKTLGLRWNPSEDKLIFQSDIMFQSSTSTKRTKRTLLSDISKLYDPMGHLTPLTTKLKIIFQEIWKQNIQWDDQVPEKIWDEWCVVKQDLKNIDNYQIPRWLQTEEKCEVELHGFCDASTKAYACVVYCKTNKKDGTSSVVLIAGKSKLVPIEKSLSMPRLELSGALLLSKLMAKIMQCLNNYNIKIFGWVDSMVVLAWLNGESSRWKPFVANRVQKITSVMPSDCWRYVKSSDNPADGASRGMTASQLSKHDIWFKGPMWLTTYSNQEKSARPQYATILEIRKNNHVNNAQILYNNDFIDNLLNKYSSLNKIIRVLAWVRRFIKRENKQNYLTLQELKQANEIIIKEQQKKEFSEEISNLKQGKHVSNKSKILNLAPTLDSAGMLRVGGRLKHANIDDDMKHPIILSSNSRLADLIIDQCHKLTYHGGARLTTAFIRKKYWLLGGNRATKKRLRLCVKCKRAEPLRQYQMMGDLPSARTNPSRPFSRCGVDYTGHIFVKANKGRGIKTTKGYVAVFVCMVTKAIHLELVSDLTSSAFLAALRRMAARRGTPEHIYCDRGSNFLGANRILQQEYKDIQNTFDDQMMSEVSDMGVKFHLNCPANPSAGGLWEASVKSLKYHLKRVVGEQHLTFEEYSTLLAQLEACLNSRPLCPLTEDPDDLNYLTPSHFLASGPTLTIVETERDLRTRWHLTQKIFSSVWDRWRNEYLTQLAARSKWRKPQRNLQINDIVVIRDDNIPPGKWALGRVVDLHQGSDGLVRVVTVKTRNGIIKRPVVKLSVLPIKQEDSEDDDVNQDISNQQKTPLSSYQVSLNKKKHCFSSVALTLLLLLIAFISPSQASYNISSLQNKNGFYFDHVTDMNIIRDDWRLVVYYNTEPYQDGIITLNKYIQYLDTLFTKIQEPSRCSGIILQLKHGANELHLYKEIDDLMNHQETNILARQRRGLINGVGYIANSLFGVLDERFAEKYEKDIEIIKDNEKHLSFLWKNQTSIVEAEFNSLKNFEVIMNLHHKTVNKKLNDFQHKLAEVESDLFYITDFVTSAIIANNILYSLKNIQDLLFNTLTNISHGKFSLHLLSPDQLRHELNVISGQLPKELSVPISNEDLSEIYNCLQVHARMSEKYLIIEIKIPLTTHDTYEVARIIPLPHQVNGQVITIVPIQEYVAINLQRDTFIPLTESDIKSCIQQKPQLLLCHLKKPIFDMKEDQDLCKKKPGTKSCEINKDSCFNVWSELNTLNNYFYFCCDVCHLKLLCEDQITTARLTHAGILSVGQNCVIKTADFVVYTHKHETSRLNVNPEIILPDLSPINSVLNLTIPEKYLSNDTSIETIENHKQLLDIQNKLKQIKESEPLSERISYHDVHHYAAIYVLFALVLLITIFYVSRRIYKRKLGQQATRELSHAAAGAGPSEAGAAEAAYAAVAMPRPAARPSDDVCTRCSEVACKQNINIVDQCSARVLKQSRSRSTSPVLRSVYTIPDIS